MATVPKYLQGQDLEVTVRRLIDDYDELYWAVAWGSMSSLAKHLLNNFAKVKRFAIGTHFHQTDPDLLDALRDVPGARVVPNSSDGTFHPKIYLFRTASKFALVLGSPNFTRAGFGRNQEAALYIEGDISDALYGDVFHAVESAWNESKSISEDFLRAYRLKHQATQAARADLEKDLPINMPTGDSEYRNLLDDDWAIFIGRVKSDPHHDVEGRVSIMDHARVWFSQTPRFMDMTEGQRKAIAGTYARNEIKPAEVLDLDWAWFGSMVGAGVFKGMVKSQPEGLSAALDFIPRSGSVSERDFDRFKSRFLQSFEDAERGGGLATASRLLALKRPDYFVCVDSANKDKLSEAIGVKKAHLTIDNYWTLVIRPLLCSPWWNSERPVDDLEGRIWDSRMAFIDAFCYER
ncbi:phospholipase D family protein [Paraburkholderia atlantica]|uniref:phospholipase D family protein n=1 Tax=Paraburkholderia atlantica TaxID=2654982 RepID=UPI00035DB0C9|nr:phospholipase D family protein [Paraburkholderia atlantica]